MIKAIDAYIFRAAPGVLTFIARLLLIMTLMLGMLIYMGAGGTTELRMAFGLIAFTWLHYLLAASIRYRHKATLPFAMLLSSISIAMSLGSPTVVASLGAGTAAIVLAYFVTLADIVISFALVIWSVYHFRAGTFTGTYLGLLSVITNGRITLGR